jgi:uncharacterized protein
MNTQLSLSQEEKTFGMLAHLTALAGFIIPFGNILGPLVIWLMKKEQSAWVNQQGKESLNFQISITIYMIISAILTVIIIGFLLMVAVGLFSLIMVIIATMKTNGGEDYKYPLCIRLLK